MRDEAAGRMLQQEMGMKGQKWLVVLGSTAGARRGQQGLKLEHHWCKAECCK